MSKRIDQLTAHPKSIADPLPQTAELVLRDADLFSDNTRKVQLGDIRNFSVIQVTDYGAKFDHVTDDTEAIQAAIDAAAEIVAAINLTGTPAGVYVEFPATRAIISDTIQLKAGVWLRGAGPLASVGTSLWWNGVAGGTMMQDSGAAFNYRLIDGIGFKAGSNIPGTFIEISNQQDMQCMIQNCMFEICSSHAIKVNDGWYNLHLKNLRWDSIGGYAIYLTPNATQNACNFSLERFVCDNHGEVSPGFICVDNSLTNVSSVGTMDISNGKIEINVAAWADPSGFLVVKVQAITPYQDVVDVNIRNVVFASTVSTSNVAWIVCDGALVSPCTFTLQNLVSNINAVIYGWHYNYQIPYSSRIQFAVHTTGASYTTFLDTTQRWAASFNSEPVVSLRVGADPESRMAINYLGEIYRGPGGTTAPVTYFMRGTGSPEGVIAAGKGSLYQREDGSANTSLYVKESGTAALTTGWVAK